MGQPGECQISYSGHAHLMEPFPPHSPKKHLRFYQENEGGRQQYGRRHVETYTPLRPALPLPFQP